MRVTQATVAAILILVLTPVVAMPCPVCYGAPGSAASQAMDKAVWFLLGVTGFVQIGFIAMFAAFWLRGREHRRRRERLQLIVGGLH